MGAMESADFCVIGAGIAGASVAYALADRGSVMLVEQEDTAGYHTTGRSAALYTELYERGPVRLLTMASRAFLESPPDGFSEHPLLRPLPTLLIGREDQRASIDETIEASADVALEVFEGPALRSLCPVLNDLIVAGVAEPASMEIDVHGLHQSFLRGVRRRGSRVRTDAGVRRLDWDGSTWRIAAGDGEITAPVVVNTSGAWADHVAAMAGLSPLGLTPLRRTAFTFSPPEGSDLSTWPIVIDVDEQFYFKPEGSRLMGSLAEETPMHPHDVRPEEIDVARAIDRIQAATSMQVRHVTNTWAGLRTFAPDRLPVVGFDPEHAGFFWLAGQGGYGIMTSPSLARAAAGLVTEGRLPEDLTAAGLSADEISPARLRRDETFSETSR
jgi:D-arginine dehydrogenase